MDALLLSRIQFGVSIGFHYLFPISTLGLTFFILIFEVLAARIGRSAYSDASALFVRMLAIIFTLGVVTGLMMPFAFGANWARFSAFAGPVFGAALTVEAMTAFALESAFLAILILGRGRVSSRTYRLSAFMVFLGAHLSAFWIVAANSWMQTPSGFTVIDGETVLTSFYAAFMNRSFPIRLIHVVTAAWLTGGFITAGTAAWYAARGLHREFVAAVFRVALPVAFAAALAQPLSGHFHIMQVMRDNPEKEAAYEGVFETTRGATLYAIGIPDAENKRIRFGIGVPYLLSLLQSGDPMSEVEGLDRFPVRDWPPVNIIFTTFHLMVGMGVLMIVALGAGLILLWKKRLFETRAYLLLLPWLVPLPYLANELGWMGAEIGRQPWVIHGVLRTADAHSALVPAWQIALTLFCITAGYTLLTAIGFRLVRRRLKDGPRIGEAA